MSAYAYLLRCSDNSLYAGYTVDPQKRLKTHNAGKGAKYTRSRLPVSYAYLACFESKHEAMKAEAGLKKLDHRQREALIKNGSLQEKKEDERMEYGIQMYSVRDLAKEDLFKALEKMAEIGYRKIEFAGFFGHSAEEVKEELSKLSLTVSGTHSSYAELVTDFEETVRYHKALGNTEYIIPGADLSTKEKLDAFIENVNRIQPLLEKEGICLSYHNHAHEFRPNEDGLIIYDELLERTSLNLEIDTYWAYVGGKDPVAMMEELKDRLRFIHIKDGSCDGEGKPLGLGTAPVDAVYEKAVQMGIPMIVESETQDPDGETEARICFSYLKKLENERA